jgi:hypothetical protein
MLGEPYWYTAVLRGFCRDRRVAYVHSSMALISRRHGFLFIMAPRTGCTAVANALSRNLGAERIPAADILRPNGRIAVPSKHTRLPQLLQAGLLTAEERRELFVFATVRNPFDSLVSLYIKKSAQYQRLLKDPSSWVFKVPGYAEDMEYCRTHSFEEWILKTCWPRWWERSVRAGRRSMLSRYADGVDFVMRFETLQRDLDSVMERVGVAEAIEVPRMNPTKERPSDYRSYYSPRARRAVEYTFRDDLQKYGYSF